MLNKTRNSLAVLGLTVLGVVGLAGVASAVPPDPAAIASGLADTAGNSFLDAIVDVLPVVIPFMVALWALGFVWNKVKPKKSGIK